MRKQLFGWFVQKNEFLSTNKNAFLAPKGTILSNRGHKTAPRAAEWAPTGKLKVSKVTSGYGEVMVPLNRVRLSARKGGYMGVALKNLIFYPFLGRKYALAPHRSPPCNTVNTKRLLFLCLVMMVTKNLEGVSIKWISVQKSAFLASKRVSKRLSKDASGYGEVKIPLDWVRPSPKKGVI